jgi:hypothetical protein
LTYNTNIWGTRGWQHVWYFSISYVLVTCEIRISRVCHMIAIYTVLKNWTMRAPFSHRGQGELLLSVLWLDFCCPS